MKDLITCMTRSFIALIVAWSICPAISGADEPGPGMTYPPKRRHAAVNPAPVVTSPAVLEERERAPMAMMEDQTECDWHVRVAGGLPIWFFDEESNLAGPGAYVDIFNEKMRINLRLGVEGRHMFLGQDAAQGASEFSGKATKITYLRIPFSVEYIVPAAIAGGDLFLGGGPDIVHTANDIESTAVGGHLSARVNYALYGAWSVAFEGGYMWGNADRPGENVSLDGAYVTPSVNYTF